MRNQSVFVKKMIALAVALVFLVAPGVVQLKSTTVNDEPDNGASGNERSVRGAAP